jgi:hypothetical protein
VEETAPESLEDVESSLDAEEASLDVVVVVPYRSSAEVEVVAVSEAVVVVVVTEEDDEAARPGSSPSWTRRARTPKTATHEARVPAAKRRREGAGMEGASAPPLNPP